MATAIRAAQQQTQDDYRELRLEVRRREWSGGVWEQPVVGAGLSLSTCSMAQAQARLYQTMVGGDIRHPSYDEGRVVDGRGVVRWYQRREGK